MLLSFFFQNKKFYKKHTKFYNKYIKLYNRFYIKKQKDKKENRQFFVIELKKYKVLIIILYIDKMNLITILKIAKKWNNLIDLIVNNKKIIIISTIRIFKLNEIINFDEYFLTIDN